MPGPATHRGVFKEPYRGPKGEIILFALKSDGDLACARLFIPKDTDEETFWEMAQGLKRTLDAADPVTSSLFAVPPTFTAVRRARRNSRLGLKVIRGTAS